MFRFMFYGDSRSKILFSQIGELMLEYGGGGHKTAGTCQVSHDRAEIVLEYLVDELKDKEF